MVSSLSIKDMDEMQWEQLIMSLDDVEWESVVINVENQTFISPLGEVQFVVDRMGEIWLPAYQLASMFGCENASEWKYVYAWSVLPLDYLRNRRGARIPFWSDDMSMTLYADEDILKFLAERYESEGGTQFKEWIIHTLGPTVRRERPPPSRPHWLPA